MKMSLKKNKNNKKGVSRSRSDNGNEHEQEKEKAEKEDEDKLWCICTVCYAAFEDLASFKKHRVNKCGFKGLILSKEDLSPSVRLTRFNNNNNSNTNSINPPSSLSPNSEDSRPKKKSRRISSGSGDKNHSISDGIDYSAIPVPIPLKIEPTTTSVAPLHNVDVDDDCDGGGEEGLFDNHDYNDGNDDAPSGTGSSESNDHPTAWSNLYPDLVFSNNETNDEPALMMKQEILTHTHHIGQINEVEDQVEVEAEMAQNTKSGKGRNRSRKSAAPSSQRPSDNNTNLNSYETNESLVAQASKLFNVGVQPRTFRPNKRLRHDTPSPAPVIPTATLDFISQALTQPVLAPAISSDKMVTKRNKRLPIATPDSNEHEHFDKDSDSEEDSTSSNSSSTETNKKERSSFWKDSYPCVFCPFIFKDWRRLKKHLKKFRTSDENPPHPENPTLNNLSTQFSTPIAPPVFEPMSQEPNSDKFKCPLCPSGFPKLSIYNSHILTLHPPTPTQHNGTKCRTCGKTFKNLRYLERHVQEIHNASGLKSFLCSSCGVAYSEKKHLNKHILRKHTEVTQHMCGICQRPCYSAKHLESHVKTHDPPAAQKVNLCAICGFSTSTEQNLKKHMFVHTDARPYQCLQCLASFKRNHQLKNHVERHSGLTHQCPDCDKVYVNKAQLSRHRKISHLGLSKSHVCPICGSGYELAVLLTGHMKRAHGEAKHECKVCGKKFTLAARLRAHAVVHDGSDEARRFGCEICGKSFKLKTQLHQHSACHLAEADKKHVCGFCGKRFGIPWHLRQHEAAHHYQKLSLEKVTRSQKC